MTMPHQMNCPHSAEGWCLACVKRHHDDQSKVLELVYTCIKAINAAIEESEGRADRLTRDGCPMLSRKKYGIVEGLQRAKQILLENSKLDAGSM